MSIFIRKNGADSPAEAEHPPTAARRHGVLLINLGTPDQPDMMYQRIWTERGSPLGSITEEQASALSAATPVR